MKKIILELKGSCINLDNIKISAAFINAVSLLYEKSTFKTILDAMKTGKIRFSSAFPHGYLPKPILFLPKNDLEKAGFRVKDYKSLRYVPKKAIDYLKEEGENKYLEELKNLSSEEVTKENIKVQNDLRQRKVYYVLSELINKVDIYYEAENEEYDKFIESAFRLMVDLGLSKRRTAGFGAIKKMKIEDVEEINKPPYILLSKSLVSLRNPVKSYQIEELMLRTKNSVIPGCFVFTEGSVFEDKTLFGGIIEEGELYLTSTYSLIY